MYSPLRPIRPLGFSLARLSSAAAVAAVVAMSVAPKANAVPLAWDAGGNGLDATIWNNPFNWAPDQVPTIADDLTFGAFPRLINLNGNETANSLRFSVNGFVLGALRTSNLLTLGTPAGGVFNVTVDTGIFARINALITGAAPLSVKGGGSLYITNLFDNFTGAVNVDGAGTSLIVNPTAPATPITRSDNYVLGGAGTRTVTLSNGGELKIIFSSYNPDGTTKNIVLGTGGGAINVAAGFQQYTLDDAV